MRYVYGMSDSEAFLKNIIDFPSDDTPRLVYADWIDERGESDRAEFIRVQCELATGDPRCQRSSLAFKACIFLDRLISKERRCERCKRWAWLCVREKELLVMAKHWFPLWETLWAGSEADWRMREPPAEFSRGFVQSVTCTWDDWIAHHAAIIATTPLQNVTLTSQPGLEVGGPDANYSRECSLNNKGAVIVSKRIEYLTNHLVAVQRILLELLRVKWPRISFSLRHLPNFNNVGLMTASINRRIILGLS